MALGARTRKAAESAAAEARAAVAEIRVEEALLRQLLSSVQRLESKVDLLLAKEEAMGQEVDNLVSAVARETSIEQSAITLITNLAVRIREASVDPRVQAMADEINANADRFAQAITANTAAETPAETPAQTAAGTQASQDELDAAARAQQSSGDANQRTLEES